MHLSVVPLPLPSVSCSARFRSKVSKLLAFLQGITRLWACVEAKQTQLLDLLLLSGADTAESTGNVRLHHLEVHQRTTEHTSRHALLLPGEHESCCPTHPLIAYAFWLHVSM